MPDDEQEEDADAAAAAAGGPAPAQPLSRKAGEVVGCTTVTVTATHRFVRHQEGHSLGEETVTPGDTTPTGGCFTAVDL
jgi:hypothetical protein